MALPPRGHTRRSGGAAAMARGIDPSAVSVRASGICGAGRGLFVTAAMPAGAVITEYAGSDAAIVPHKRRDPVSHMLRVPGEARVIDGWAAAQVLTFEPESAQWRPPPAWQCGLGALANAAARRADANAVLVWAPDDRAAAAAAAGAAAPVMQRIPRDVWAVLPRAAFLVARRSLVAGEEVLWWYAPVLCTTST